MHLKVCRFFLDETAATARGQDQKKRARTFCRGDLGRRLILKNRSQTLPCTVVRRLVNDMNKIDGTHVREQVSHKWAVFRSE